MEIRAAVVRETHAPMSIEKLELEAPRPQEILVKVVAAGICHTDLVVRNGIIPMPLPAVLGHEGAGVIEAVGIGVTKVMPGDHVVMTFDSCGTCPSCEEHHTPYCYNLFPLNFLGQRADGSSALSKGDEAIASNFFGQSSFATYALCHEANIVKIARDFPLELAGPLGCGIQTGAGSVLNALRVTPGKSISVSGAGAVGLSGVMAAKIAGATTIIAIDMNDSRLELAMTLGATHTVNAGETDVTERLKQITGNGVDFAMDTTGVPTLISSGFNALAPRGLFGLVAAPKPGAALHLELMDIQATGRRIMGITQGNSNPDEFIPALIQYYRQGVFPFDRLVKYYAFDDINQAIEDCENGLTVKAIVKMQ